MANQQRRALAGGRMGTALPPPRRGRRGDKNGNDTSNESRSRDDLTSRRNPGDSYTYRDKNGNDSSNESRSRDDPTSRRNPDDSYMYRDPYPSGDYQSREPSRQSRESSSLPTQAALSKPNLRMSSVPKVRPRKGSISRLEIDTDRTEAPVPQSTGRTEERFARGASSRSSSVAGDRPSYSRSATAPSGPNRGTPSEPQQQMVASARRIESTLDVVDLQPQKGNARSSSEQQVSPEEGYDPPPVAQLVELAYLSPETVSKSTAIVEDRIISNYPVGNNSSGGGGSAAAAAAVTDYREERPESFVRPKDSAVAVVQLQAPMTATSMMTVTNSPKIVKSGYVPVEDDDSYFDNVTPSSPPSEPSIKTLDVIDASRENSSPPDAPKIKEMDQPPENLEKLSLTPQELRELDEDFNRQKLEIDSLRSMLAEANDDLATYRKSKPSDGDGTKADVTRMQEELLRERHRREDAEAECDGLRTIIKELASNSAVIQPEDDDGTGFSMLQQKNGELIEQLLKAATASASLKREIAGNDRALRKAWVSLQSLTNNAELNREEFSVTKLAHMTEVMVGAFKKYRSRAER